MISPTVLNTRGTEHPHGTAHTLYRVKISPDVGRLHGKHVIENQTLFTIHVSSYWEFIRTPLFTRLQIRNLFRFVQLCCKFTRVSAFTHDIWVIIYLLFFCVLIFIRIDPNLHTVSKRIKLLRTNIYKVLQFIRVILPAVNRALIGGPTYLLV